MCTGRQMYHWHTGTMTRRAKGLDAREPVPTVESTPPTRGASACATATTSRWSSRRQRDPHRRADQRPRRAAPGVRAVPTPGGGREPADQPPAGPRTPRSVVQGVRRARREGGLTMDLGLQGRVALVAGSSAGLGFATARTLAAEGAARRRQRTGRGHAARRGGSDPCRQPGAQVLACPGDVAKPPEARALVERWWGTSAGSTSSSATPAGRRPPISHTPGRGVPAGAGPSTCSPPCNLAPRRRAGDAGAADGPYRLHHVHRRPAAAPTSPLSTMARAGHTARQGALGRSGTRRRARDGGGARLHAGRPDRVSNRGRSRREGRPARPS